MADTDRDEQYHFMQETFKDEVSKGRRIWNFIWRTVGHGLIIGIVACIAFYIMQPWVSDLFGRKDASVNIPDDETVDAWSEEDILGIEDYEEMKKAIYQVAEQARTSMVEISVMSDELEDDEHTSVSGLIVWKGRNEIDILASSTILNEKQDLQVRFVDDTSYPVELKIQDMNLQMAVFTVRANALEKSTWDNITCAKWCDEEGISNGTLVLCLGQQFGDGTIDSVKNYLSLADKNYDILTTDISDAQPGGTGVLFNMDGEVVGIADHNTSAVTKSSLINAYAISDIKTEIEYLLNGRHIPYLGIRGIDVTEEIHEQQQIPMGIYVKKVEADSPAMKAGIHSGDVIVKMNHQEIRSLEEYSQILQEAEQNREIRLTVKRQGSDGYVDVNIDAIVGMKR